MKIWAWMKVLVMVLCLGIVAGMAYFQTDSFQRKYLYPFPYQDLVSHYAQANRLDPYLVASVIKAESKFSNLAKSPRGAMGLMQMMPETAEWVAKQMDETSFKVDHLNDPDVSIRFGTWYLASLRKEFKNNDVLALAAYNGGRGNVKQWMKEYNWSSDFADIDQIPFKETRQYVRQVLSDREKYKKLYSK